MRLAPMTYADLSILGAVAAYLAPILIVKYGAVSEFNNKKPRDPAFYRDPYRARGLWAHQNGMEGFAFFVAAVLIAQMRGTPQNIADGLAVAYVALRFAYDAAYLVGAARVRSAVWALALAVNVALLLSPMWAR